MPTTAEDWKPLEARLPVEECTAFWYMGRDESIYLYRHIDTGKWLYLDEKGNCFDQSIDQNDRTAYKPADFKLKHDQATGWGKATNWGQVSAFETALDKALQQSAAKTPPEPGGGLDR